MRWSKFRTIVLGKYSLDVAIIKNLFLFFMENSSNRFHEHSSVFFKIAKSVSERLGHFVNRLYSLSGIWRCAILENLQFLKFGFSLLSTHKPLNKFKTYIDLAYGTCNTCSISFQPVSFLTNSVLERKPIETSQFCYFFVTCTQR